MRNPEQDDGQQRAREYNAERRARVQRLLFAGAAFGTAVVVVGTAASPKIPPFVGE